MKLTTEELGRLYRQQTARSADGRTDCLPEEILLRVAEGHAGQSEREMAADHLMSCSGCALEYRLLLELKPWAERAAVSVPVTTGAPPPERRRLDQAGRLQSLTRIFPPRVAVSAMAAVLIVTILVLVFWSISLKRGHGRISAQLNERLAERDQLSRSLDEARRRIEENARQAERQQAEIAELHRAVEDISQPQINVPIIDLELQAPRGGEDQTTTILMPANASLFTVILHVADGRPFADYLLEVMDGRGRSIRRVQGLRRSEAETFTVALPRRLFPADRYRFRLYGLHGRKSEPLGDYSIRVRDQQ
ncbi:MAG TPA: hypothetical protein VJ302_08605 [Blastocatellia bacterium]|nr:hypothetical protein [Blastocatellia bacterium]